MEVNSSFNHKIYQMEPEDRISRVQGNTFSTGRILVGRAQSCDFTINSNAVSAVHAVIETTPRGIKIYDMNSKNGSYINGKKVIVSEVRVGDRVSIGNVHFRVKEYVAVGKNPPESLPSTNQSFQSNNKAIKESLDVQSTRPNKEFKEKSQESEKLATEKTPTLPKDIQVEDVPYISYPLDLEKGADNSEYIFEESDQVYPIFKYKTNEEAIEIIILNNNNVFSVDYIPLKDGIYSIVGARPKRRDVEFPYLGREEKTTFIDIKNNSIELNLLHGYEVTCIDKKGLGSPKGNSLKLNTDDIVRMQKEHLDIFVRKVPGPPKVASPPYFGRDKTLKSLIFLSLLGIMVPVLALNFYNVDEELKKEKNPERIATILYKQKLVVSKTKAVEKTEKAKPKKQKAPKKKVVEKVKKPKKINDKSDKKVTKKVSKKDPGLKKVKKDVPKKVKKPITGSSKKVARAKKAPSKSSLKTKSANSAKIVSKSTSSAKSASRAKSLGAVDVYKSNQFKSTISSLMAKGGGPKSGARVQGTSSGSLRGASVSGSATAGLKKANIKGEVGSLSGAVDGKITASKGAEGLSAKKGIFMAGIPSETVVMGSMDPDIIRRILKENLPQFRYCYQKELDRTSQKNLSGTIGLLFTIGASGHVSKAGITNKSSFPSSVRRCVVGVLRGIKFPRPLGGGVVEVKQPFNFYPKRL